MTLTRIQPYVEDPSQMPSMAEFNHWQTRKGSNAKRCWRGYKVQEDERVYLISIDIPGIIPEDIFVDFEGEGHVLHLTAMNNVGVLFSKSFMIGDIVNTDQISAHFADGVLEVVAPKLRKFPSKIVPVSYDTAHQDKPSKTRHRRLPKLFRRRVAISEERR
jgi:HSP20 family molecular chaperone IbpA